MKRLVVDCRLLYFIVNPCYISLLLSSTEMNASEGNWSGSEATLDFPPRSLRILANLTRARLNLSLASNDDDNVVPAEEGNLISPPTVLMVVVVASPPTTTGEQGGNINRNFSIHQLGQPDSFDGNTVLFDISTLIRDILSDRINDDSNMNSKITFAFQVRRPCYHSNNDDNVTYGVIGNCPPIINTDSGISYLRLDFVKNEDNSNTTTASMEQLINILSQKRRS
jgi:hypothetical protein